MPATNSAGKTSGVLTDGASITNRAQNTKSFGKTKGVLMYGALRTNRGYMLAHCSHPFFLFFKTLSAILGPHGEIL